jgi:NTE family protein
MNHMDYSKKKVALVLSGGSAKGLCHIGILKGLEEMGITPAIIVGTSMGALIGAMYCWNPNLKWIYFQAKEYKIQDMLSPKEFLDMRTGLIKGNKLESRLRATISDAKFSQLKIPLVINATDIRTGTIYTFTKGSVVEAVRASVSVPFLLQPVIKGRRILVDGGLLTNMYFQYLVPKAEDYDLFVLVNLNDTIPQLKPGFSVIDQVLHDLSLALKNQVELNLLVLEKDASPSSAIFRSKMVIISPSLKRLSATQFGKLDEFIRSGHNAFLKSRPKMISILRRSRK